MSDSKPLPQLSPKGQSEADRRNRRQAEALRANLARRKAQVRGRADDEPTTAAEGDTPPADSPTKG